MTDNQKFWLLILAFVCVLLIAIFAPYMINREIVYEHGVITEKFRLGYGISGGVGYYFTINGSFDRKVRESEYHRYEVNQTVYWYWNLGSYHYLTVEEYGERNE